MKDFHENDILTWNEAIGFILAETLIPYLLIDIKNPHCETKWFYCEGQHFIIKIAPDTCPLLKNDERPPIQHKLESISIFVSKQHL